MTFVTRMSSKCNIWIDILFEKKKEADYRYFRSFTQ